MRSALAHAAQKRAERRQRVSSLSTVPPSETSADYDPVLASIAASILYRSPLPSQAGRSLYILNAAAFPDAFDVDYDSLLSYVLARLPGEDELLSGAEYEIVFFAGGQPEGATSEKKQGPGMGWYLQAYHVLSRATRKKLQRLYIVHPRTWVRVLVGVFGTIVSPKFRRKIIHVNTLSALALQIPIEMLLIPPSVYLHDRKLSPDIYVPFVTGKRAFGVKHPLPKNINTGETRLPRVLRETTSFILMPTNIQREGLFRIPPHSTLASVLKEAYDRGQYFIIWKEKGATFAQPGIDPSLVDDVRIEDAYGVHLAASLIKQWYRDLREPIFPESSYDVLKEKYSNPDTPVTPEDLVEIIFTQSEISPLSKTAREIVTRHLLPLLSEVAAHESNNKMNAENLAICFSMCLVCGSNYVEDAKVAAIVRRILQAAIEMWPQLREGMDIPPNAFYTDIQAPADWRDYEDPLEENLPPPQRRFEDGIAEASEGHRIVLQDSEESPQLERVPTLPQRIEMETAPQRAPTLPPRPRAASSTSPVSAGSDSASPFPKRKPAPPILEPPRYSTIFDAEDDSLHIADSPTQMVPVDGFGPPRHGPFSFDESEKKGFPPLPEPAESHLALKIPNDKAMSAEQKEEKIAAPADVAGPRSASDGSTLAKMAAQRAAAGFGQQANTTTISSNQEDIVQSPESVLSEGDGLFRKPSWPASARQQSLAKPMLPPRQSKTFPLASNGSHLTASNVPRPRAPSPGLLQRMRSMELDNDASSTSKATLEPEPKKLNLKRPSVDDLKRLYEERLNTALGLAEADAARKGSTSSK